MRAVTAALVLLALLACVPAAFAQGCALCRTSAAATGEEGGQALNLAILVLLLPTVTIFAGVLFFAFRYRNRSPWLAADSEDAARVSPLLQK